MDRSKAFKLCEGCGALFWGNNDKKTCCDCNGKLEYFYLHMPILDCIDVQKLKPSADLIKEMNELYVEDIDTYNLRMKKYRKDLRETKCPKCNSIFIRPQYDLICSTFGLKTNKRVCEECGYKWRI